MNIQFGHPRVWDYMKEFYQPLTKAFPEHKFLFPHIEWEKSPNSRITLKEQDIFLCEVSLPATGLWIEIWFASIYWVRIICMYKSWSKISGSFKYVTEEIFEYESEEDMIEKLKNIL